MIKGFIFDLDGLLLDTEKLYNVFWKKACADFGFTLSNENALSVRSMTGENAKRRFAEFFGESFDYSAVRARRIKLMDEFIKQNGVLKKQGATELLKAARARKIRLCTATTSPFKRAERLLKRTGLFEFFDEFACGDMVKNSKPAPDIYLLATKKLKLSVEECIGFEDSPNGIKACAAAGIKAVMIPDLTDPDPETKALTFRIYNSLTDAMELLNG